MTAPGPVASAVILPSAQIVVAALPPLYVTANGTVYLDQSQLHLTAAGSLMTGSIGRGFGKPSCHMLCCKRKFAAFCMHVALRVCICVWMERIVRLCQTVSREA